eukprot:1159868-Pelagomonas_calceolata.AAC.5
MAIPPTLASHLQCVASQTFRLRPALSQADMRVTSTFLASSSKPVHQLASGHASDDLNADSSTGLPLQADQMQQQLQQQRVSQPPKKRGRKPKHALEDERAEALPGPDASPRRRRAGRRRTTEAAAGSESKRKPNLIRKPRANSVAAGSHDTPSNGGQTQSSAARPAQDHSIPVIPLPPPPVHAAARPGPGSEEGVLIICGSLGAKRHLSCLMYMLCVCVLSKDKSLDQPACIVERPNIQRRHHQGCPPMCDRGAASALAFPSNNERGDGEEALL